MKQVLFATTQGYDQNRGVIIRHSEAGFGCATWGSQTRPEQAHRLASLAVDLGINVFDTGDSMPIPVKEETFGHSESILGDWLQTQQRDKIVISTKMVGYWWHSWQTKLSPTQENIRASVHASLKRLKTDYIDMYMVHWPERNAPRFGQARFDPTKEREFVRFPEQAEAFSRLVQEGKIRSWGLCNESVWGVCHARWATSKIGGVFPTFLQSHYSLLNHSFEWDMHEACYRDNLKFFAYSPLAWGMLTGKYLNDNCPAGARLTAYPELGERYTRPFNYAAVREYINVAKAANLDPAEMAIAFVKSRPFVHCTLISATSEEQLRANAKAFDTELSQETLQAIEWWRKVYPCPSAGL